MPQSLQPWLKMWRRGNDAPFPRHSLIAAENWTGRRRRLPSPSFQQGILDKLRKAEAHNTFKRQDIAVERLDPFAGTWVQAEGEFIDADGEARRMSISLGPEQGTVGPDQVKEAARPCAAPASTC